MLEGKALFVAVMMLTAAPIAATDEGQAFLGDITYDIGEMLDTEEENKVIDRTLDDTDIDNKELLLTDENLEVDCLTLGQWKEQFSPEEKVNDERKESKENDKARGNDDSKEDEKGDEKKENYPDKEDWADKETVAKDDDCLTAEEWVLKSESNEEEPCFTLEDLEKKMKDDRKDWDHDWESDWNEEWAEELELLAEACKGGNEEACEELLAIREELAEDREGDDGARGGNDDSDEEEGDGDSHADDEADDYNHVIDIYDENWDEIRAVIQELAEACENGDEDACVELREMITEMLNDRKEGWNKDWHNDGERDWNEDSCLTMEEWKKIFNDGKDNRKGDHDRDDDRKERGPHRDAFVREMLEELEYACEEEGNEEACAELEEVIAEFEEREGECDKERDDEEDEESDEEENWEEEDESDEDETDEDESDEEEPNA